MKKEKLVLAVILLFVILSRLFRITDIPPSVYWDEASIGYNAYSVLTTAKDEWGEFLPLHFRAFGDFKLPVYIYSTIPFVKILGLNPLSTRLPSVFYSLISVILLYLLAKKISGSGLVGIVSAFIFSVIPWFFIFSRTGYEASAGLAFFLLAFYAFILSRKEGKWFIVSTISLIASIYSYNSFSILSPPSFLLFIATFVYERRKNISKYILYLLLNIILFFLALVPIARLFILDAGALRFTAVSFQGSLFEKILAITQNYFSHFSYKFLFSVGDGNLRSNIQGFGELYLISLALLISGLIYIFKKRKFELLLVLGVLLIACIPASITRETPHALRTILFAPFASIMIGLGAKYLQDITGKYSKYIIVSVILIYLAFFESYYWNFINLYSKISSSDWQYGYKVLFTNYKDEFNNYQKVIISDEYAQPYIFTLYYLQYDSNKFRQDVIYNPVDKWGFSAVKSFGNIEFKKIENKDIVKGNLVFASPNDKPIKVVPSGEIKFLNGNTAFFVYKL